MSNASFQGGDKFSALLQQYQAGLQGEPTVSVGFFSRSTESKTHIPSAQAAQLNEYGSTRTVVKKDGTTYTVTTPPRPFFRSMIRDGKPEWGDKLGEYLLRYDMNAQNALDSMGELMKEQLIESAQLQRYAPLADSTVARKGHDQTLIDSGDMIRAINFQVDL